MIGMTSTGSGQLTTLHVVNFYKDKQNKLFLQVAYKDPDIDFLQPFEACQSKF
jgi:hypothetical protein